MRRKTLAFSLVFLLSLAVAVQTAAVPAGAQEQLSWSVECQARRATVIIEGEVQTPGGLRAEIGAGVIVGQDGGLEVVTAYHVADGEHLQVTTWDGEILQVTQVVHDPREDLAIVKTSEAQLVYPNIKMTAPDDAGSPLFTYGAPNDDDWTLGSGDIRNSVLLPSQFGHGEFAMTCSKCDNGSSGGGIFNAHGNLEGILFAGYTAQDGVYSFLAEPVLDVPRLIAEFR